MANLVCQFLTALINSLFGAVLQNLDTSRPRLFSLILLNLSNTITIVSGVGLLLYHFRFDSSALFLFISISLLSSSFAVPALLHLGSSQKRSPIFILWAFSFALISLNESAIFLLNQETFIKLRPNVMLLIMKSISYFAEEQQSQLQRKSKEKHQSFLQTYLDFTAYLLHPSVLILGVWHPHLKKADVETTRHKIWLPSVSNGFFRSVLSFILCLLCLLISSCFIDYYLVSGCFGYLFDVLELYVPLAMAHPLQIGLLAYSVAVQFHYSHYFICFAAQAMFDLWDFRFVNLFSLLASVSYVILFTE